MSELEQVKILIGIDKADTSQDELIEVLLERAGSVIDSNTNYPDKYKYLKVDAVIYGYNQLGAEGNKSENSGGFGSSWFYETMSAFIKASLPNQFIIE